MVVAPNRWAADGQETRSTVLYLQRERERERERERQRERQREREGEREKEGERERKRKLRGTRVRGLETHRELGSAGLLRRICLPATLGLG